MTYAERISASGELSGDEKAVLLELLRRSRLPNLTESLAGGSLSPYWTRSESGCWVWGRSIYPSGYGNLCAHWTKTRKAHRIIYEIVNGPIPNQMALDHICRNRLCVNPDHLEAVSSKENILRGNGWGAKNKMKTVCVRGHKLDNENIRIEFQNGKPNRRCIPCLRYRHKLRKEASRG